MNNSLGVSGRIAAYFQSAQITPLLALVALLLGIFAVLVTPREEEPQINVTMANVLIPFPGAGVADVEQMVTTPAEQVLSQIAGIEHVMSVSRPGLAVITVQFKVGVPRTEALVRLYDTVQSNADWLPRGLGVLAPIIKPKGIDDVPIVTLTLFSRNPATGAYDLERVAHSIEAELKRVPGTREVVSVGGQGRAVRVEIDPTRMASRGVTVSDLRGALQSANLGLPVGELLSGNHAVAVESGPFLKDAREVGELVVSVQGGKPVFLQDVASVVDGPLPAARYVWHGVKSGGGKRGGEFPAVTISITKKAGENAIDVADAVMQRVDALRNTVIPHDIEVVETRNYGATANDKAIKLIQKLLFATAAVVALVFIALGRREAAIVGSAVILTLTVTLFASWAWGFTLNRVSLFALIFSIGILVDDAIVVVENIHRHQQLYPGKPLVQIIPGAVDEVGGPTILATLTVIAALLPMAFVSGLMGPYMSPIPINASMGMLLSLAVAFVVTPWLARLWMKALPADAAGHGQPHGLSAKLAPLFQRIFDAAARRAQRPPQPLAAGSRRGRADRPVGAAAGAGPGAAEDAALRQQVRVPGHRRHARRHAGGAHRRRAARAGRTPGDAARGDALPGLCRHGRADQLQRPGAPVLPAQRRRGRRHPGQPGRQAAPRRAEPCHRHARAHRRCRPSASATAPTSRWWKCRRARRCCRRWWPRSMGPKPMAGARWPRRCATSSPRPKAWSISTTAASPTRRARCWWSTGARPRCRACRSRRS